MISLFFGLKAIIRCSGKLKIVLIFLTLAVGVIIIRESLVLTKIIYTDFLLALIRIATIFFIFIAFIMIMKIIENVGTRYDKGNYKNKRKRIT